MFLSERWASPSHPLQLYPALPIHQPLSVSLFLAPVLLSLSTSVPNLNSPYLKFSLHLYTFSTLLILNFSCFPFSPGKSSGGILSIWKSISLVVFLSSFISLFSILNIRKGKRKYLFFLLLYLLYCIMIIKRSPPVFQSREMNEGKWEKEREDVRASRSSIRHQPLDFSGITERLWLRYVRGMISSSTPDAWFSCSWCRRWWWWSCWNKKGNMSGGIEIKGAEKRGKVESLRRGESIKYAILILRFSFACFFSLLTFYPQVQSAMFSFQTAIGSHVPDVDYHSISLRICCLYIFSWFRNLKF